MKWIEKTLLKGLVIAGAGFGVYFILKSMLFGMYLFFGSAAVLILLLYLLVRWMRGPEKEVEE